MGHLKRRKLQSAPGHSEGVEGDSVPVCGLQPVVHRGVAALLFQASISPYKEKVGFLISNIWLRSRIVRFSVTAVTKWHVLALMFNTNDV